MNNKHLLPAFLKNGEIEKYGRNCLYLARKLAQENNIDLKVMWIKGSQNPADYFSRQNLTIDRKKDQRRKKIIALISEPDRFNITLNIPLNKVLFSRVIKQIEKHFYFIKYSQKNEDIDAIWNAWELYWALKTLVKDTTYIQKAEEKEKARQFIKNLEIILKEKSD